MPEGLKGLRIYRLAEALGDEVWDEVARTLERKAKEGRAKL